MSELDVGDRVKFLLLQRVHDGRIAEYAGFWFDGGRRIWYFPVARAYQAFA